jgi:hypothetical protein
LISAESRQGFAVDPAIEILKRKRVMAGIVNAGGDVRVFGSASQLVHLRHPAQPNCAAGAVRVRERAIATSECFSPVTFGSLGARVGIIAMDRCSSACSVF